MWRLSGAQLDQQEVSFTLGDAGSGGASAGNSGANGVRVIIRSQ